jgi:hypothetical protein
MTSATIKANPDFLKFISLSEEEIRMMGPTEVTELNNTGNEFLTQFNGNKEFISFLAAVHNSLSVFGTVGMAYEEMIECRNKLPTTPWINSKFRHNQMGKIKKDFEKYRAQAKLHADYQKAKEDFQGLLNMAHGFLLRAQRALREC